MSNVIEFLERMGADAELRHATQDRLEAALAQAEVEPELRAALLARDLPRVTALLGASTNVCCALSIPDPDDEDRQDDDEDDGDEIHARHSGGYDAAVAA